MIFISIQKTQHISFFSQTHTFELLRILHYTLIYIKETKIKETDQTNKLEKRKAQSKKTIIINGIPKKKRNIQMLK
ncbi:hypothetical protein Py17XNL_001105622 [Plasmodium yoelii yoelii]|uniref:Uncharacterized protein n=1 Tax=Plasmodium yoelii yoelii TaxID=73239 RepID=A0AAE9WTD9_PLAYO|nr:hypothetical protein Py17XNL_001105622 [Plasmodium yoelii yoelii]